MKVKNRKQFVLTNRSLMKTLSNGSNRLKHNNPKNLQTTRTEILFNFTKSVKNGNRAERQKS